MRKDKKVPPSPHTGKRRVPKTVEQKFEEGIRRALAEYREVFERLAEYDRT